MNSALKIEVGEDDDFTKLLNPSSSKVVAAKIEPFINDATPYKAFQFERLSFFFADLGKASVTRIAIQ